MPKKKQNTRVSDHYTARAKKEGYPARSVYKLEEIQQKFKLIGRNDKVLDVGAAPGSWTLYCVRELLSASGKVVSVDLQDHGMGTLPDNVTFYQGDAFSPEVQAQITEHGVFDSIICDAAPNTTGTKMVDVLRSQALVESLIYSTGKLLKPHGNMVIKIFQGGDEREINNLLRQAFTKTKRFKPQACRKDSYETYIVCIDRKEEPLQTYEDVKHNDKG